MFLVDERVGSKDLLNPLVRYGVPAELSRLEFGDFAFVGKGMQGADVLIGIELKETRDLVSNIYSTRYAGHQQIGLQNTYDRSWLITEGIWREGDGGIMEVMAKGWRPVTIGSRRIMMNDVESWLLTQAIRGGITHQHCATRQDTIRFLSVLYHWWTDKELQEHRSHKAIYQAPPDRAAMTPPSNFVKGLVGLVDDIGWERAHAVEEHFNGKWGRMSATAHANPKELLQIPGIGKVLAGSIRTRLTDV